MLVKLSATQVVAADDCRRLHQLRYVEGVKTVMTSANLVFGSAVDESIRNFLNSLAAGVTPAPPDQKFEELWDKAREEKQIQYPATKTPEDFRAMGVSMMKALPEGWDKTGWIVATDKDGAPLTDRFLSVDLGTKSGVRVKYRGKIDVAVYTAIGEFGVVDIKTAAVAHTALYTERSDQLSGYQLLVDANAEDLGVPPVETLGFFDLIKRKAPSIQEVMVGRRSDEELEEYVQKMFWLGEDIKRKRFPRASRHAYNSPCQMCEYARLCVYGETDGLTVPATNGGPTQSGP